MSSFSRVAFQKAQKASTAVVAIHGRRNANASGLATLLYWSGRRLATVLLPGLDGGFTVARGRHGFDNIALETMV
jgi:hypothetical protein